MKKRSDGRLKIAKFQQVKEDKLFSPIKYFVEEVINSFDESDLHRTWVKVSSHSLFFFRSWWIKGLFDYERMVQKNAYFFVSNMLRRSDICCICVCVNLLCSFRKLSPPFHSIFLKFIKDRCPLTTIKIKIKKEEGCSLLPINSEPLDKVFFLIFKLFFQLHSSIYIYIYILSSKLKYVENTWLGLNCW